MEHVLSPGPSVTSWDIWAWRIVLQSGSHYRWKNNHIPHLFYPLPQKDNFGPIVVKNLCFKLRLSKAVKTKIY